MRALCLGFLVAMAAAPGWAGHGGGLTQQVLRIEKDGTMTLTGQVSKPVFETKEYAYTVKVPIEVQKERVVNGKPETFTTTEYRDETRTAVKAVMRLVFEQIYRPVNPETLKAFETDGRKIAIDDLKTRCRADTLVVVSGDDAMIPDYYATVFKPGTIILALPQMHSYAAPAPQVHPAAPAPPPPASTEAPKRPQASLVPFVPVRNVSFQAELAPQDSPKFPASPSPQLVFASREGVDAVKIRQFMESKDEVQITVRENDSSVAPEKPMTAQQLVRNSTNTFVPWSALRVSTPEGGDLTLDRAKERLGAGETAVLLSADGRLVDAFWLQNIKSNVLVIRGVQLGGGMGHYGMPAPMPAPVAYPVPIEAPQPAPVVP